MKVFCHCERETTVTNCALPKPTIDVLGCLGNLLKVWQFIWIVFLLVNLIVVTHFGLVGEIVITLSLYFTAYR